MKALLTFALAIEVDDIEEATALAAQVDKSTTLGILAALEQHADITWADLSDVLDIYPCTVSLPRVEV